MNASLRSFVGVECCSLIARERNVAQEIEARIRARVPAKKSIALLLCSQYIRNWGKSAGANRARILQEVEVEMLSKSKEIDIPGWGGLSWARFDEMFHDGEGRRSFKIEECHDGDTMIVRAELPGIDPDKDVQVEVVDGELMISAQRTETHKTSGHHVPRSEFRYGSFTRSIPLPPGVDESKVEATYKDGVLEVRLQVPQQATDMTSRRIQIKRS